MFAGGSARRHRGAAQRSVMATKDRKSTRLNSRHTVISYAVFCLTNKPHRSELRSHTDLVRRLLLHDHRRKLGTLLALARRLTVVHPTHGSRAAWRTHLHPDRSYS